jgi:hypothetical protein
MRTRAKRIYANPWVAQEWHAGCLIVRPDVAPPYSSDDIVVITGDREFADHLIKAQAALLTQENKNVDT